MQKNKIIEAIATVGYIGYLPFAPGTFASLAGLFIYLFTRYSAPLYYTVTIAVVLIGFYVADRAAGIFGKKDPREVVIDEVAGMLIVYLFLPYNIPILIGGFLLFRLFDIVKMPPIKNLQQLPGSYGIMLDDIAAAVLTNMILRGIVILTQV